MTIITSTLINLPHLLRTTVGTLQAVGSILAIGTVVPNADFRLLGRRKSVHLFNAPVSAAYDERVTVSPKPLKPA
jgi:hypothetical protein